MVSDRKREGLNILDTQTSDPLIATLHGIKGRSHGTADAAEGKGREDYSRSAHNSVGRFLFL
jgi:hypothetical protein